MKKFALTFGLVLAGIAMASAQGTVKIFNSSSSFFVSTNGTAQNGTIGVSGKLTTTANQYYFALLIDSATPTSSNPLTGGWTVAQSGGVNIVANNYNLVAGAISGTGGTAGTTVDGWVAGTAENVELVGWSASLGTSWAQISAQLESGLWNAFGYYGVSGIGNVVSGGSGTPSAPAASLFGASGIASGFNLNGVSPVPEPGTMALAGLGGLAMLAFRRKK